MKRCGVTAVEKKFGLGNASATLKAMCASPVLEKVSVASREKEADGNG